MESDYKQEPLEEERFKTRSPASRRAIDPAFLDKTIQLFQPRMKRPLSREDARQIVENMTGFFQLLAEWDRAERAENNGRTDPKLNAVDSWDRTAHSDS